MVNRIWQRLALLFGFLAVLLALAIAVVFWRPHWLMAIGLEQPMNSAAMDMPMDNGQSMDNMNNMPMDGMADANPIDQTDLEARWAELMARWQALYTQVQNGQSASSQVEQLNAIVAQMQSILNQMQINNAGMAGAGMNTAMPMGNSGMGMMGMMDMMMGMMGMGGMSGNMNAADAMNNPMSMATGGVRMSGDTSMAMSSNSLAPDRMVELLNQMMQMMNEMQRRVDGNPTLTTNPVPVSTMPTIPITANNTPDNLLQIGQIDGITVTVTPFSLKNVLTDTVDFYLTLDTPVIDPMFDPAKLMSLQINDQEIPAQSWTVLSSHSLPIVGKLRFPVADANGNSLLASATRLSLLVQNSSGDKQHVFVWDVPKTE